MGRTRLAGFLVVVAGFAVVAIACGSVPDIEFVDADAGPDGATSSGTVKSDASSSGAPVDAAGDQSSPAPTYCSNGGKSNPPPGGICCGSLACVGCNGSDCSDCTATCKTRGTACCKRGQVRCSTVDLCK